jgi:hypothetical protein
MSNQRLSTSIVMPAYNKVTIFIDIEGPPSWPNEIGAIATCRGQIVDSFLGWCPPQCDSESLRQFHSSHQHCHGLRLSWLKSEGESIQSLCTQFYRWVLTWKPEKFAANGTNDVNLFLTRFGLTTPVVDVNLPNWRDRQHLEEHHEAAAAKRQETPMPNGLCCPYMQAHHSTIKVSAGSSENRNAKISHGSHCALYDAYEVTLYALNRNLPQL